MSVDNLLKILVRAIEARERHDVASRASVYVIARATLERFFEQSTDLDEYNKAQQRQQLESAISEIEAEFSSAAREGASSELETIVAAPAPKQEAPRGGAEFATPPESGAGHAPRSDVDRIAAPPTVRPPVAVEPRSAPPAPTRPPLAPPTPSATPAAPAAPPPPAAAAPTVSPPPPPPAPPPPEPEARPTTGSTPDPKDPANAADDDSIFAVESDARPDDLDESAAVGEDQRRRHNRRGAVALILILITLGVVYKAELGGTLRRLIFLGASSEATSLADRLTPPVPEPKAGWTNGAHPLPTRPTEKNRGPAHLHVESPSTDAVDFVGQVSWTPVGSGAGGSSGYSGTVTLTGHPLVVELVMEPTTDVDVDLTRMLLVGWTGLAETMSESPTLRRIDRRTGRPDEINGVMVRVGIDRVLFGYKPEPTDQQADFDSRALMEITFPLASGKTLLLLFGLPDPR